MNQASLISNKKCNWYQVNRTIKDLLQQEGQMKNCNALYPSQLQKKIHLQKNHKVIYIHVIPAMYLIQYLKKLRMIQEMKMIC